MIGPRIAWASMEQMHVLVDKSKPPGVVVEVLTFLYCIASEQGWALLPLGCRRK